MLPPAERCPWCARPLVRVEVHGHVQCASCGINVDPCCQGAAFGDAAEVASPGSPPGAADERV